MVMARDLPPIAVSASGQLVLLSHPGSVDAQLPVELGAGVWPTWHPTRPLLATSRVQRERSGATAAIVAVNAGGNLVRTLHTCFPGIPPLIAPRIPHYVGWSPDGLTLSFVAQAPGGLTLFLSTLDGNGESELSVPVASGAPIFSCWLPDSSGLLVHAGPRLAFHDLSGPAEPQVITERGAGFRAPAVSGDGLFLAFASPAPEGGVIVMAGKPPAGPSLARGQFSGGVTLGFRPHTHQLTVAVASDPEAGVFSELWSVDLDTDERTLLFQNDPFVAFSWSPAGDRLLTVNPTHLGDGRYCWTVRSPDGWPEAYSEALVPGADSRVWLSFFDQYDPSHPCWSPDGEWLLLAARPPGDGVSGQLGDARDFVFAWDGRRQSTMRIVAPGDFAQFSRVSGADEGGL